jgi:hypothetical protein
LVVAGAASARRERAMTGAAADEAVTLMRKLLRQNGLRAPSERWESDMAFLAS